MTLLGSILVVTVIWFWPPGSWFVEDCKLDGQFGDWRGRAYLGDEEGDAPEGQDLKALYWSTNQNEQLLYFMLERYPVVNNRSILVERLYFDINANGNYSDKIDKYAEISYQPNREHLGQVKVELFSVQGILLNTYSGSWGEGYLDGGQRLEFSLPMNRLQVYPAQSIRFYLAGIGANVDRLPNEGDNQWAPFPVTVKSKYSIVIVCLTWMAITLFLYRNRIWVFYYVWGAVGLCCLLILLLHGSWVEYKLQYETSMLLHHILDYFGIVTRVFDKAPGALLVLIEVDNNWTTIDIDIENSGFLEVCIIFSLVMFYPVYRWGRRTVVALSGVLVVYVINLIRLLIVIAVIHQGGRDMSFIAHTVIGRFFFFIFIIALYWRIMTKPTLTKVREFIKDA
jgi:exosortase family protein XrtG